MKLNYKRTILVGFAFFLICAFWQAYDATIPMILTNKFGMSQAWSGVIMAADNVLAVILLPLFGTLSDKCRHRSGRRTPFIVVGTLCAAILLVFLSFADNAQLKHIDAVSEVDNAAGLEVIYDTQKDAQLMTPSGAEFVLSEEFSRAEFTAITAKVTVDGAEVTNGDYTNFVVPARQAYVADVTAQNPSTLIVFVVLLLLVLLSMAVFRSPAVALMPDVTLKPLRSKANAIINLMGAVGGLLYLVVAAVMYPNSKVQGLAHVNYQPLFIVVSSLMFIAIAILFITIKEPKLSAENQALEAEHPEWNLAEDDGSGNAVLPKEVKRSLGFLLASIALWFMGYNGVTTWFTTYVSVVMGQSLGGASTCLLIATGGAIVSYVPIGSLASKFGRKRTIQFGIILLASCFALGYYLTTTYDSINFIMFVVFALVGLAWAAINVNSLPMVVEMCRGSDVGKFTGFYYTASMSAQVITPVVAGTLLNKVGYFTLFPYAAAFVSLSFVTLLFVKHGDAKE